MHSLGAAVWLPLSCVDVVRVLPDAGALALNIPASGTMSWSISAPFTGLEFIHSVTAADNGQTMSSGVWLFFHLDSHTVCHGAEHPLLLWLDSVTVWLQQILFIFQPSALIRMPLYTIPHVSSCMGMFSFLLSVQLGGKLLSHWSALCFTVWGTARLISMISYPHSEHESQFLCICMLTNHLILAILVSTKQCLWYLSLFVYLCVLYGTM